jgi:hypothetical protein
MIIRDLAIVASKGFLRPGCSWRIDLADVHAAK